MASGWIKLHRQIQDCWIWDEDEAFDRRSAWIDLLLLANHDDHKTFIGGELVIVKRGQRLTSIRKLAERWRWGNEKTLKFLRVLESEEMIERSANAGRTLITIVNYEKFQGADEQDRTQTEREQNSSRTPTEHESSTNKNIKNDKKEKNEKNDKNIDIEYSDTTYPHTLAESHLDDAPPQYEVEAPVELIPLNDGSGWRPTMTEYEEYERLYPNVDIDQEFRKMRGWCMSNSRKTKRGIKRFVNNWLSRAQDKSKGNSTGGSRSSPYMDAIRDRVSIVDTWE